MKRRSVTYFGSVPALMIEKCSQIKVAPEWAVDHAIAVPVQQIPAGLNAAIGHVSGQVGKEGLGLSVINGHLILAGLQHSLGHQD